MRNSSSRICSTANLPEWCEQPTIELMAEFERTVAVG